VAVLVFNAAFGFLQQGRARAVDLNADHLAACVLDSSGNPVGDPTTVAVDTAGLPAERRDGRLQAAITALLERHRRCLHERYPVLGAAVGHITDLETIVGQRVTGATRREN